MTFLKIKFKWLPIVLIVSMLVGIVSSPNAQGATSDSEGSIRVTLSVKAGYNIDLEGSYSVIRMQDFAMTSSPGDPMLPHKLHDILLPPDALQGTVKLNIVSAKTRTLDGTYDIKPAGPDAAWIGSELVKTWGDKNIVNSRNVDVYQIDTDFPKSVVKLLPCSQMRKWKYVRLDFNPFQYNPVSGTLTLTESVDVEISYGRAPFALDENLMADTTSDNTATRRFLNYTQARDWYNAAIPIDQPSLTTYDYVIITTNVIVANSTKLSNFVTHRQGLGYSVLVVTYENDIQSLTGQAPDNRAEKIRQWLINNYATMGIEYVLLIGDPHPYESGEGDIPMKMCHPEKHQSNNDVNQTPTDYFYADLTGNWDIDGDQDYGEWDPDGNGTGYSGDFPVTGGVDFDPEVYVGRIPVYNNEDCNALDSILQKMMDYDNETSTDWRANTLLPMGFQESGYDGAQLAEQMRNDYLIAAGYSTWRMYQQGNGPCGDNSVYTSNEELRGSPSTYPAGQDTVENQWTNDDVYGIVCWWAHGSETSASVGYSGCWDGTLFQSSYCSSLDDDHPAFTYQCSCTNGYPENSNNLQYAILEQGGIATVSATRLSWYNSGIGYGQFDGSTTNSGIGYEYVARLVQALGAGVALYEAKSSMSPATETRLMNWYDFNLYGDPTQYIKETQPGKSPPEHLKWSQPPIEIDSNSVTPIYCGWDEPSFRENFSVEELPCWNNPRQCHGDADNALQGTPFAGYMYVGSNDKTILMAAMGTVYPDPAYNHCADFNRDYKVDDTDLQILNTWLDVKEPPQGPGVPPNCPPEGNIMQQYWHVVADDFRCLGTMPVTSVHWWGSYQYWDGPEPPFIVPEAWRIGFWTNVPEPVWSSGKLVHDPEGIGSPAGDWGVLEVVNNGTINTVGDAVTSLESGKGDRLVYNLMGPLNINDHEGSAANFGGDVGYGVAYENLAVGPPWPAPGSVEDLAFLARGRINIPTTGDWTFYIRSDEGEELSIDYGALVIGSEGWQDNNFGTINLTAGDHDIQVIHRERTGGANVEVAAAKGATNNLYFFRLIGSGDPGLPARSSFVPGFPSDPSFTQSKPGESGAINNLAQAQAAISNSIANGTAALITDDRVNHSDPDNRGLGNDVFASDRDNPWDLFWGAGTDDDDSAILVQGEIWIPTPGTYYIGYNSDDGARLIINTGVGFKLLSIVEDTTGSAVITTTYNTNDTLQTDVKTGKSWTVGEFFFVSPGSYPFELLMFERGGGFFVEMFGGTIPGVYDLLVWGYGRPIPVPEVAPALDLVQGQPPIERDYSYPKELIWDIEVPADRVQQEFVGYDQFPDKPFDSCFQYYVDLQPDEWFPQDPYTDIHFPEPVAYYKLNGDANDSSGNGYDGTEYGGPAYVPGIIGQAIDLDGLDDYVDTGYTTDLPKWTIAAWVTSPATPTAALPSGPVHREKNYQINWNHPDPLFRGAAGVEVAGTWYAAGYGTLNANTWYHLAATYDGNVLKAYKNGDLIMSNPSPSGNPTAETASLTLGKHALAPQFFAGSIDDVRIYDRALSKEQIKTQMIGLVAHYKMDESAGLIAADSSCNGNHATLSDGPTWQPTGGKFGGALLFDGIDDYVDCGSVGISGNDERSITGWAKASTTAIPPWTTVFGFSNAGSVNGTYFDIEVDNSGNYVLNTNGWKAVFCPVDLDWHHFAAVYSGGGAGWYLDGAPPGSAPVAISTIDEFRMGSRKMSGNYFPGLIDDVGVWNWVLDGFGIYILMNYGSPDGGGDPNMYALWKLDETSGYTAIDSSDYGNHGTLNDPPVWRPMGGQIKGTLDFDGKDDFVDNGKTASQLGIGGNHPRTITAWVFTRSFKGGGIYEMGEDGSGADGRDFSLRTKWVDNNWRLQYWGAAYDADFTYTSKNKWVHFAHVHDGISTRIYADGQEVVNVPRTLNTTNNKTFRLGRWQNNYFDGLIDDVRIYNRALGADEIKSLNGSGEDIFWLSVTAVYPNDVEYIQNPWGFKTRPESWMDDAVRFDLPGEPGIGTVIDPCIVTPIEDPATRKSFDVAFELDTDPDYIKWEQPFTGFRHWPHYEDERSKVIVDPAQDALWIDRLVADDWRCDRETPVTAAVWWGSYIGYEYYACQEQQLPAPLKPDYFWLTIWTDVPAGQDPNPQVPFSHPGQKIWEYMAYDYDEVMVGYDKYPHGMHKEPVFRYSVRLPKQAWFLQEDVNNIYWFSVVAVYKAGNEPLYEWGWTNHSHFFNDNAVAGIYDPVVSWWFWEELYDQTENSQDMSFMLFTEPDCLNKNAVRYADWIAWGKPDCWCYKRQCRGDIDGIKTGPFWVAIPDLNLFRSCFNKTDMMMPPSCICADLDHMKSGPFRAAIPDLFFFRQYFNKTETLVPICDQPPIYTGPYNFWTKP